MEMNAKYSGFCKKCGVRINQGDRIDWASGKGASHVTCPAKAATAPVPTNTDNMKPAATVSRQVVPAITIPDLPDDTKFVAWFQEGEYYSGTSVSSDGGYVPARVNALDALDALQVISSYLNGWGTKMERAAHDALGDSFTWAQAKAYAVPILEAARAKKQAALDAKLDKRAIAFAEAKRTNERVVLRRWSEGCDGSTEECDVDNLTEYALPDGTTKVVRNHTW
jgi:hypothetical protein